MTRVLRVQAAQTEWRGSVENPPSSALVRMMKVPARSIEGIAEIRALLYEKERAPGGAPAS